MKISFAINQMTRFVWKASLKVWVMISITASHSPSIFNKIPNSLKKHKDRTNRALFYEKYY